MAQDFQSIGKASREIDEIASHHDGWQDQPPAESLGHEITDQSDYSEFDRRANKQQLGREIPNMAGYSEPPMAAVQPTREDTDEG